MDYNKLLSLRSRLGHVRSDMRYGWKGHGRPLIVSQEWLHEALETWAFELEHKIVEGVGINE